MVPLDLFFSNYYLSVSFNVCTYLFIIIIIICCSYGPYDYYVEPSNPLAIMKGFEDIVFIVGFFESFNHLI